MRAKIMDETTPIYAEIVKENPVTIATLKQGDEVQLGKVTRRFGKTWVAVTRPDGRTGFLSGEVRIFPVRRAELADKTMNLYTAADPDSDVLMTLSRKAEFSIIDKLTDKNNAAWVLVRLPNGREGFLPGKARIRELPEDSIAAGKKLMLYGCVLTAAATGLLYLTRDAGSSMDMLLYVAVALGLFQFFQGLIEYNNARKAKPPTNP